MGDDKCGVISCTDYCMTGVLGVIVFSSTSPPFSDQAGIVTALLCHILPFATFSFFFSLYNGNVTGKFGVSPTTQLFILLA